jgi:hypothetical protein
MKPIVDGLEGEYTDRVVVERLNIDDPSTSKAKATYKFRVQPYFVLLDGESEVVNTWQGYTEKEVFDEAFFPLLGP